MRAMARPATARLGRARGPAIRQSAGQLPDGTCWPGKATLGYQGRPRGHSGLPGPQPAEHAVRLADARQSSLACALL